MKHVLRIILLLSTFTRAMPLLAQDGAARVIVSRDEARVIFPPDTASAWGWGAQRSDAYDPGYTWGVLTEGLDGSRRIFLDVDRDDDHPRRFPSLATLVAAGKANLCPAGVIVQCETEGISAQVEGRNVMITVRGPMVARMFALRPVRISVWRRQPGMGTQSEHDSAHVEYVDPQIPQPGVIERQATATALRAEEARATSVRRMISARGGDYGPIAMTVGDSLMLSVIELTCRYDYCGGRSLFVVDSLWAVEDRGIARLRIIPDTARDAAYPRDGNVALIAERPGRTLVRVAVGGSGGNQRGETTQPAWLEREVIVRARASSVKP